MANERTYPILPWRELDEAIAFYQVLGFKRIGDSEPDAAVEKVDGLAQIIQVAAG